MLAIVSVSQSLSVEVSIFVCLKRLRFFSSVRLQIQGGKEKYKDMGTALRMIVKEEGPMALYKGAIPRMVVVGPLFGITLLAFEAQKQYMIKNGML